MRVIGRVESLYRYPVKSMKGEVLPELFAGFPGVYGDRAFAFRSSAASKGFPYFTAREQERMLLYQATYRYPDRMLHPPNLAEAEAMGPGVTPQYAEPAEQMVDVLTPSGGKLSIDDPRLIDELCEGGRAGVVLSLMRSTRSLTDCRPVSLISTATVRQLGSEVGVDLNKLRFRANIYVELTQGSGLNENEWVGHRLRVGDRAEIAVTDRDPRCKMITLDPETGEANPMVMRCVAKGHDGKVGVYGAMVVEGVIRAGDPIALITT